MSIDFIFTLDHQVRNHSAMFVFNNLISHAEDKRQKSFFDNFYHKMHNDYLNLMQPFWKIDSNFSCLCNENKKEPDIHTKNYPKRKWYNDSDMIKLEFSESENVEKLHNKSECFSNSDIKNDRERKLEFIIGSLRKNKLESRNCFEESSEIIHQEWI